MIKAEQKIELLAPAKNKECAFAAINAGADAVYIGADSFGARKKAGNPLTEIKEITDYAHKFNVKIYVTVNTLIFDNELDAVEKLIWDLYEIGVDAVIFQDFAVLEMNLPPIALHASTQCNNDTLEKIEFLNSCNVQRVVLPREFSIDEIKNITKNCSIETEVFVHGALCVSYSGQCYLSNHIGRRSANRGDCAQPCRKKFSLIDEKGNVVLKSQYLLSMKDFSLANHLNDLVDSGVTSLKIEGRLKDADYVKNIVSFYRKKIDEISGDLRPSIGEIITDFNPNTHKTFNRGYTNFYFDAKRKQFINPETPKFMGEKIGPVKAFNGKRMLVDSRISLNTADKIAFFDKNGELTGTTITIADKNGIEVRNSKEIQKGTVIYRNYDADFAKKAEAAKFSRKIPIDFKILQSETNLKIQASCCNMMAFYEEPESFEEAKNIEKAKENLTQQFSKLGDTEFYLKNFEAPEDFKLFIPVSKLNEIRRNIISLMQAERKKAYELQKRDVSFNCGDYPVKKLDYSYNIANSKSKIFYEKAGADVCKTCPEVNSKLKNITLMKTKHCLRDFAGICLKNSKSNGDLYLLDDYSEKYKLDFDCNKCIMKIEEPS